MYHQRSKSIFVLCTAAFLAVTMVLPAYAVKPVNADRGDVAIRGYDPVAYFQYGKPTPGKKEIVHSWNGADWRFASAAHRDLFAADPEKFAPQYGGYCAYAVSKGSTAKTDPEAWTVHDGKLYLNYSLGVMKKWRSDIPGHIAKADVNWPRLLAK